MTAFADVGATCAEASCGRQVAICPRCKSAIPITAVGDELPEHVCKSQVEGPCVRRCAGKGCKEALSMHNTVNCWRCRQDVCIKHRFEDAHDCVSIDDVVKAALVRAQQEMTTAEFEMAQKTLLKVFGNILAEPGNEKFRTLKKANTVVQEKLRHSTCQEALRLSGFHDVGEAFVCRPNADLGVMRQMTAVLKTYRPEAARSAGTASTSAVPTRASSTATPAAASGTRLLDGVIVRTPPRQVQEAKPSATSAHSVPAASTAAKVPPPVPGTGGQKPRSAFDFEKRGDREKSLQVQEAQLAEARRQQKERYQTGGAADSTNQHSKAPATPVASTPGNAAPTARRKQDDAVRRCAVQ
eukprot:TRINITY_DN1209_c0_g1_i1.p1 TRINITY_DN1209_c0_g1~~TRINITY_DN1209_c0_g1_i1.p1  ORF type:complete len:379 (+),score=68.12 TRINITY_DN1209_c0_g1_i1:73-1137(+)